MTYSDKQLDLILNKCTKEQYEAILSSYDLSALSDQVFFVEVSGSIDALSNTIINVADGIADTDAVNLAQIKTLSANLKNLIDEKAVSGDYVTSAQLSTNYYDKTASDNRFQEKGNYLSSNSLTGYYDKQSVNSLVNETSSVLHNEVQTTDNKFQNVYTKTEANAIFVQKQGEAGYVTQNDLSVYLQKQTARDTYQPLGNYVSSTVLNNYYDKTETKQKLDNLSVDLDQKISSMSFDPTNIVKVYNQAKDEYIDGDRNVYEVSSIFIPTGKTPWVQQSISFPEGYEDCYISSEVSINQQSANVFKVSRYFQAGFYLNINSITSDISTETRLVFKNYNDENVLTATRLNPNTDTWSFTPNNTGSIDIYQQNKPWKIIISYAPGMGWTYTVYYKVDLVFPPKGNAETLSVSLSSDEIAYYGQGETQHEYYSGINTTYTRSISGHYSTTWVKKDALALSSDLIQRIATTASLGEIKVGNNLSIDLSGKLDCILPTASTDTLGGIKIGNNLSIENGILSAITPKVLTDFLMYFRDQNANNLTADLIVTGYNVSNNANSRTILAMRGFDVIQNQFKDLAIEFRNNYETYSISQLLSAITYSNVQTLYWNNQIYTSFSIENKTWNFTDKIFSK